MYFPKTDAIIDSRNKSINHAKKHYDSIENAYLDVHNIDKPRCKYCNNVSKFISLFQGYHNTCYSKECLHFQTIDVNQQIADNKAKNLIKDQSYIDFIKNNIEFYKTVKRPFLDPYLNIIIKDTRKYFNKKDIKDILLCPVTKKYYEYNYFYSDDMTKLISYSKQTANIRKYLSYDDVKFILDNKHDFDIIKSIYETNNKTKYLIKNVCANQITFDLHIQVPKLNPLIEVIYKNKTYEFKDVYVQKTDLNMNDVLSNDELTNIVGPGFNCFVCNIKYYDKLFMYNIRNKEFYIKDIKISKTCGKKECYQYVIKYHKKEFYPISIETKLKQSNTMKKLIYDGLYYPVNNRKHHTKYEIDNLKLKSTWEVIFYCYLKYNNKNIKYESTIIKYSDNRNYFIDFYLPDDEILYEVKPTSELDKENIISKHNAAQNYAKDNNILFKIVTENDIIKIIKDNNFLYDYIEMQDLSFKDKVLNQYKNFMKEI